VKKTLPLLLVSWLLTGCAIATPPPAGPAYQGLEPRGSGDFHLVVMGDTRPWCDGPDIVTQNEYFRGNIERANASAADFTVIVGDLICGRTDDAALIAKEWDAYDKMCRNFKMPYISVIGNHDVWNPLSQQIYRRRYGLEYFSWNHKGCHFIALDSEIPGQQGRITGEQLQWLKEDLAEATSARRIFVFLHAPLWTWPPDANQKDNAWNRDVHPLLAAAGVDTVFAGHTHQYALYPARDGVRYLITGGGGAELRGGYALAGEFFHFVDVSVKDRTVNLKVVTADGMLPADVVTPEKIAAAQQSLQVESAELLPNENRLAIRLHVKNPTGQEARAVVTWNTAGTPWQGDKAEIRLTPSGEGVLEIEAKTAKVLHPLPKATVELFAGSKKLFGWPLPLEALIQAKPTATP